MLTGFSQNSFGSIHLNQDILSIIGSPPKPSSHDDRHFRKTKVILTKQTATMLLSKGWFRLTCCTVSFSEAKSTINYEHKSVGVICRVLINRTSYDIHSCDPCVYITLFASHLYLLLPERFKITLTSGCH